MVFSVASEMNTLKNVVIGGSKPGSFYPEHGVLTTGDLRYIFARIRITRVVVTFQITE